MASHPVLEMVLAVIAAGCVVTGAIVGILNLLPGYRAQKLALQTRSLAQLLYVYADSMKKFVGTNDIEFSDEEFRKTLRSNAPRLHAVIALMMADGRIKKSDAPGYWIVD